jgi:hypothetical protein
VKINEKSKKEKIREIRVVGEIREFGEVRVAAKPPIRES